MTNIKRAFQDRGRPHKYLGSLVIFCVGLGVVSAALSPSFIEKVSSLNENIGQVLFLIYLMIYLIVWIFYFVSIEWDIDVQTLRRLLRDESKLWDRSGAPSQIDGFFREKAKTTITSLAIIIAASTLLTTRVFDSIIQIHQRVANGSHETYTWNIAMLYASIIFACAAFLLLLIAVDALDTTFNEFRTDSEKIISYYYRQAVYPKYFGLVSVIFSFIFYIASFFPEIAASATGLLMSAGYYHWFPNIYEDISSKRRVHLTLGTMICLFPLAVLLLKHQVFQ